MRSTLRNFTISVSSAWHLPEVLWFFFSPCPAQAQIKKKKKRPASPSINWSQQYLSLSPHFLSAPPGTCSRFRPEKKEKCGRPSAISVNSAWHLPEVLWFFFRLALRKHRKKKKTEASNPYLSLSLCKLGLRPEAVEDTARSSDPKKKGSKATATTTKDKGKETEKRQRRDREETEKRQRRDREETEKRCRDPPQISEKRQRRDREETKKRSAIREETEKRQRRDREVRSTLHNFFELRLARVPSDHPKKKKSAIHSPQFLSARPGTCSKFFIFFSPCPAQAQKKKRKKKNEKKMNLHRSRVPAYTHNLMTAFDISVELRHLSQKNWTDLGACFDYTHISQTWCIWNDNLYPTSTTRHMDGPWNDQPFWWARTSSQHRNLLKISMLLFFFEKKKS